MSRRDIDLVKGSPRFRLSDLWIYAVVLCLLLVSFAGLWLLSPNATQATGIEITFCGKRAATLEWTGRFTEYPSERISFAVESTAESAVIRITVEVDGTVGHNELQVDLSAHTVAMESADCTGRDCTLMKIGNGSDSILCLPHRLVVSLLQGENWIPDGVIL